MATQSNGSNTANIVLKAVFFVGVVGVGIRGASELMKAKAADEAHQIIDAQAKKIAADTAAKVARDALTSLSSEEKAKLAGIGTTQPSAKPMLTADKLVGTWNTVGAMSCKGFSVQFKSVDIYNADGTYTGTAESTWTVGKPFYESETTLNVLLKSAGNWKLNGNELMENVTARDSRAADDVEDAKIKASPHLASILLGTSVDGDWITDQITSATANTIQFTHQHSGIEMTGTMTRLTSAPAQTASAKF